MDSIRSLLHNGFALVVGVYSGVAVLALLYTFWITNGLGAAQRAAAVHDVLGIVTSLIWPIAAVLISIVALAVSTTMLDYYRQRASDVQKYEEALLRADALPLWSDDRSRRIASLITEAYDQYEQPISAELAFRLQATLREQVQSGKTDILKDKNILWLHKDARHDRLESLTLQICGASVHWCFTVESAVQTIHAASDPFDLIISHMGEREDAFQLFTYLPDGSKRRPFIVYTRKANDAAFQRRANEKGIRYFTNLPDALFEKVIAAMTEAAATSSNGSKAKTGNADFATAGASNT